ncbi:HAD hydrolase family protein [Pedobacter sp. MC2016-14]|uniref:KdsC family phosphatase n=1 Tax=Pedobacter sp. MC2016-14 TaxID=2897327 RepID=UPI001E64CE74|nr:HAD hydrolase family protein [Pedobacter sp. MC2016-14]MCD0488505.1 HAD hydrolase family protein [Pedobacter sp. MC2016-14]
MFLQKIKKITAFVFDVDGVLTTGDVLAAESGELLRTFNIKDGYAMQLAIKKGYQICIISGGQGQAMQQRFERLGITDIFLGVGDKVAVYHDFVSRHQIDHTAVLYMGDDMPDLKVMQLVGLPVCPADAVPEIRAVAEYISPFEGGKTAVRDVIEKVLKVQGKWYDPNPLAVDSGK